MWKKLFIAIISFTLVGIVGLTNALQVRFPRDKPSDPDYQVPGANVAAGETKITDVISLVNSYLRFAVGFVCFLFMVWNGYQLIMARGDENQMKKATSSLIGSALGLLVCLLAYIIVNIAVKFFQ